MYVESPFQPYYKRYKPPSLPLILIFVLQLIVLIFFSFSPLIGVTKGFFNKNETNAAVNPPKAIDYSSFPPVKKRGRVFDNFMYNNEAYAAYVRIWRHAPYVDYFIIVYSNKTFSNRDKELSFEPFTKDLEPYKDKIILVPFDGTCNKQKFYGNSNWCREKTQRDFGIEYIEKHFNPTRDDVIIVSDVDEILTRPGLRYSIEHPPAYLDPPRDYYVLHGDYYFPVYFHRITEWDAAMIFSYAPGISIAKVRVNVQNGKVWKLQTPNHDVFVTHCSYCFPRIEDYKNKLESYSHSEYNRPPYTTNDWIFKSQYCHFTVSGKEEGGDIPIPPKEELMDLFPDDDRIKFLYDPSFTFDISKTSYKPEDLPTLCQHKWRRSFDEP